MNLPMPYPPSLLLKNLSPFGVVLGIVYLHFTPDFSRFTYILLLFRA